ncbi:MAG TPA: DNA polymerase ligase N-terminal domain-containing protein [Pirellulales bacterium]
MSKTTPVPFVCEARFVVLRHETPAGSQRPTHWDFMLETPAGLRTWALASQPDGDAWIAAEALADHRAEYLTFEGPLSGGRGAVEQWDAGSFRWQGGKMPEGVESEIVVQLAGKRLRGRAILARLPESDRGWRFFFAADSH